MGGAILQPHRMYRYERLPLQLSDRQINVQWMCSRARGDPYNFALGRTCRTRMINRLSPTRTPSLARTWDGTT